MTVSANIGVCGSKAIWLLTDAATVRSDNGFVHRIATKQLSGRQGVVAWTGWSPPALRFAGDARTSCDTFDGVLDVAPFVWRDVRRALPPPRRWMKYGILLAGWSEQRQQLELYSLQSDVLPNGAELIVSASAGVEGTEGETRDFCEQVSRDPDGFDPADGIVFMSRMRRHTRQFDEGPPRHVIGGFVTCTRVTRDGAKSAIIHTWPDLIGQPISA